MVPNLTFVWGGISGVTCVNNEERTLVLNSKGNNFLLQEDMDGNLKIFNYSPPDAIPPPPFSNLPHRTVLDTVFYRMLSPAAQ